MNNQLLSGTGGLVVVDGPDIHIPGIPDTEVTKKLNPCRLTVTLRGVYYGGDNVGSEWEYRIAVNNKIWCSGLRNVQWRSWDAVNQQIYDEIIDHGCGLIQLVTFFVRARERDWYIFDDIGERADVTAIPCTREKSKRRVVISVPVVEYPGILWRWMFRRFKKIAMLYFFFEVEAQCVE